ncbi:MAG: glycerol-3-phosphate acyltransferase, partial [Steroidobacteraceae bacterium]
GKGGATLAGTLLALAPSLLLIALGAWFAVSMLTGFVGLATTVGAYAVAVAAVSQAPASVALYAVAMAVLVAWAHRGNFARMRARTEPRLQRLWLLRPRGRGR